MPPETASVVDRPAARVGRRGWLAQRAEADPQSRPMSIYEVHLGSWRRDPHDGRPRAHVPRAGRRAGRLRHRHGLHARRADAGDGAPVRGLVGLPGDRLLRARVGARLARRLARVHRPLHQHGIGVLLDWVPAHFPRDDFALARFDGTALYEHADPRRGAHPDWGTLVFNYGRHEVRNFLLVERAVLAARVPRRRPARRRRRVDALPRLLAQGGRVGAERATAAARTSTPSRSSRR